MRIYVVKATGDGSLVLSGSFVAATDSVYFVLEGDEELVRVGETAIVLRYYVLVLAITTRPVSA